MWTSSLERLDVGCQKWGCRFEHGADDKLKKKKFVRGAYRSRGLSRRPYPLPATGGRDGAGPAGRSECSRRG